jgi:hypothetical protein
MQLLEPIPAKYKWIAGAVGIGLLALYVFGQSLGVSQALKGMSK